MRTLIPDIGRTFIGLGTLTILSFGVQAQVLDNVDLDGLGKSAIVVRSTTTSPQLKAGRYANGTFAFSDLQDPGLNYRLLGATKLNAGAKSDLLLQNIATGDFGEARTLLDFSAASDRLLRNVKRVWDVQAVGDLDGDGLGDLVWRYMADDPRDTGVSFIWFTNGASDAAASVQNGTNNVPQVRKRGGAPLSWTLLGARDINGDGAADMAYISPDGAIRMLMATAGRTCANLSAGTVPTGMTALKFDNFSGDGRGDILYRNNVTGAVQLAKLNATGLTLPPYAGLPDDPIASCTSSSLVVTNTAVTNLPASDPTWQLYAVGDYDGNGVTDIVWLQPNGQLTLWLMNAAGAAPTVVTNAGQEPFTYAATEEGELNDARIAGVSYVTSSGVRGVTNANGKYRFNKGDTVTFSLGTLTLGTATATGVISPIHLAGGNANKLTNLLVLLQSLDSDGNPANGINITAPTAAAVTSAINLTSTPSTFDSSANMALQAAMMAGGLTGSMKTVDQANQHFASQLFAAIGGRIYGGVDATGGLLVRIAANGEYLQGQASADVFAGNTKIETAGVEYGFATVLTFDVNGYRVQGSALVDTNLQAGLSHPGINERVLPQGESIRAGDGGLINKVENIPGTIVGAWALFSPTTIKTQTVIFGSNGKFMDVDPTGDGTPNSRPGVEFGSYTYNAATKILKVSNGTYDTNGGNGFLQSAAAQAAGMSFTLNADGITATVIDTTSDQGQVMTAYRISR
jgi:hypothetical protein